MNMSILEIVPRIQTREATTLLFIQMTINLCDHVGMLWVCIEIMQIKAALGSPLLCRIEGDIEYDITSQGIVRLLQFKT